MFVGLSKIKALWKTQNKSFVKNFFFQKHKNFVKTQNKSFGTVKANVLRTLFTL